MSVFLTEFPISKEKSSDDFVALCIKWIMGMDHSKIREELSIGMNIGDRVYKENDFESIDFIRYDDKYFRSIGVRYGYREEDGRQWLTEVVSTETSDRWWVSVKGSCDSSIAERTLPRPRKPYIVKLLMRDGWGGLDDQIETTDQPIYFDNEYLEVIGDLILGRGDNRLPIVYISALPQEKNRYIISPSKIAKKLGGIAHVIVEPSSRLSFQVAQRANFQNPYNGSIGVYWPFVSDHRKYYIGGTFRDPMEIERAIVSDIERALANRRTFPEGTWQFLKEKLSARELKRLKESGSAKVEDYIAAFDVEIEAKKRQIEAAEEEIRQLKIELQKKVSGSAGKAGFINPGNEMEFFHGEKKSTVLNVLRNWRSGAITDSRRFHIVNDIIIANESDNDVGSEMMNSLKNLLKDYRNMSSHIRSSLLDMGFSVSDEGKHYKLVFRDDGRYTFSLPKTASDHRSGKNFASDVNKSLFL